MNTRMLLSSFLLYHFWDKIIFNCKCFQGKEKAEVWKKLHWHRASFSRVIVRASCSYRFNNFAAMWMNHNQLQFKVALHAPSMFQCLSLSCAYIYVSV